MKTIFNLTFSVLSALVLFPWAAGALPTSVVGENLITHEKFERTIQGSKKKALVVVFLSAKCPCSDSHMKELESLAEKYTDFEFVGVHSNVDESKDLTENYFTKNPLPFPVVQDSEFKLADEFKALKTPHAFVVSASGEVLYQGGVSNSKKLDRSDRKFLREALQNLEAGEVVRTPLGRTLGCAISRGNSHVW